MQKETINQAIRKLQRRGERLSFAAIGRELGISKEWTVQLCARYSIFPTRLQADHELSTAQSRLKRLRTNTATLRPREIFRLAGVKDNAYHHQEKAFLNLLKTERVPYLDCSFQPKSRFTRFALTLKDSGRYTPKEIATLAGFPGHTNPCSTLTRIGVPYLKRKGQSGRGAQV
jgi:hypothetical protein